jgi:hypothetical protein
MGAADRARELVGVVVWPFVRPLLRRLEGIVRSALPDGGFDAAFAAGRALDPVVALDVAARDAVPDQRQSDQR